MTKHDLVTFLRKYQLAVQASVASDGAPQAAVIGFVVSDDLELFFDTLSSSRKYQNLTRDRRIALVIGWDDECTVQLEGVIDEPSGTALRALQELYFARFPEGPERQRLEEIRYLRVRPTWVRYSDFSVALPDIVEIDLLALS